VRPEYGPWILGAVSGTVGVLGWYMRRLINAKDRADADRFAAFTRGINENAAAIIEVANRQVDLQQQMTRDHYALAERVAVIEARKSG